MTNETLPQDVTNLAAAVHTLPIEHRRKLLPLVDRLVDSTKRRRRILSIVSEAVGQLRLDVSYLIFDLDCTRRERDALKQ